MSHASKDCLERPRRVGARWSHKQIAPDELLQEVDLDSWDAKRDRWNGYEPEQYQKVVDR